MIDSGGFGCIYKPAVRCSKSKKRYDGVTKLLMKKYGLEEYKTTMAIQKILKKVPNYNNYYIVSISKCIPNKLTPEDKKKMDCYALNKKNITKKNVNSNLNKLIAIQMPYGGPTLKTTVKNLRSFEEFTTMMMKVLDFYQNGLVPMNKSGIVHSDMKLANLLYDEYVKLIDWGFTINLNANYDIKERKFHFNLPFTVILFEKVHYTEIYFDQRSVTKKSVETLVLLLIQQNKYDSHLEYLDELYDNLDIKNIRSYIVKYLTEVIYKYTDNKTKIFDVESYFHDVYIHNCDIWGFMMMFVEMHDYLSMSLLKDKKMDKFVNILYKIIDEYLLNVKYATEKYDTQKIYNEIEKCIKL